MFDRTLYTFFDISSDRDEIYLGSSYCHKYVNQFLLTVISLPLHTFVKLFWWFELFSMPQIQVSEWKLFWFVFIICISIAKNVCIIHLFLFTNENDWKVKKVQAGRSQLHFL